MEKMAPNVDPNQEVFTVADGGCGSDQMPCSCSMDSLFEEIFKDTHACTHTHTCNPPGADLTHTHSCLHVHTKILSAPADESAESAEKNSEKKRLFGNREAVRKYREKRKARAASLEDENRELRAENQQLLKKLDSLGEVEAENMRLKCLLVDLRGRIDGEIGAFPYQRQLKDGARLVSGVSHMGMTGGGGAHVMNSCNLPCEDQLYCSNPPVQVGTAVEDCVPNMQGFGVCEFGATPCAGVSANEAKGFWGCGRGNRLPSTCTSTASGRKGANSTAES